MKAAKPISAKVPDWSREKISLGYPAPWKYFLLVIRSYQRHHRPGKFSCYCSLMVLTHHFLSAFCGADVPINSQLAGGLMLPHPNGIVIHPEAVIGFNCLFFQQVTIGMGSKPGLPILGGDVEVGAGAKILGGIRVGDHVKIGANAVVLTDVPDGATAVGIPARIIPRDTP